MSCPICLTEVKIPYCITGAEGSCGHVFCLDCLSRTPKRYGNFDCPSCRKSYYNPKFSRIYMEVPKPKVQETLEECIKRLNEIIATKSVDIINFEKKLKEIMIQQDETSIQLAREKEKLEEFRFYSKQEKAKIKEGEGILFDKMRTKMSDEIQEEYERMRAVELEKFLSVKNSFKEKIKYETIYYNNQILKIKEASKGEYEKYYNKLQEFIKKSRYQFVFLKSSEKNLFERSQLVINELIHGLKYVQSISKCISIKQKEELKKTMRHITKLDISMFIDYVNKSGSTGRASPTEIIEIEREIDRELEKFGESQILKWVDV